MVHVSTNPGSRSAQCPYPWGISHVHRFTTISRRFLGVTLPEGLGLVLLPLKNRLTNMCLPVRRTGEPFSRTSSEGVRKASAFVRKPPKTRHMSHFRLRKEQKTRTNMVRAAGPTGPPGPDGRDGRESLLQRRNSFSVGITPVGKPSGSHNLV